MSRARQIRFLSAVARLYEPVVALMGFRPLWRALAEIAAPVRGERALDVCTGTGGAARALARAGARVVGIDLARGMLRRGRDAGARVRMDARRLAFPDRAFPLVTCCMALHEMGEPERARVLAEIRRVARDRVVIADYRVPETRNARRWFRLRRGYEYLESDDFEPFVARDFGERLREAGFAPTQTRDVAGFRIWRCALAPVQPSAAAAPSCMPAIDSISRTSAATSAGA